MTERQDVQDGGCFCSDVRYRVTGASVWQAGCCCRSCTRMHSAPYVVWAGFSNDAFQWLKGEPKVFRSSAHVLRTFCPRCGTDLTYQKDPAEPRFEQAGRFTYVSVPSLDHPEAFPPSEVVRASERVCWLDLGTDIPLRDELSPTASELQVGSASRPS